MKPKSFLKQCVAEVLVESSATPLVLVPTGMADEWSRPVYKGADGKIYVDINLGKGTPSIHSVTDSGEPEFPIKNFTISHTASHDRFKNALCPRCKNSKPELMKKTPDGKMSCTYCHWEDNPGEPYNPPINEGDESDAVCDMNADAEAEYYKKNYGSSKKKDTPKKSSTPKTPRKTAVIKVKGKPIKLEGLLKECIAEVVVEPEPKKLLTKQLVKECVLEVLKDNLMEGGFDPQSQAGPNSPRENPYPEMNAKMAKMEEDNSISADAFSGPQSSKKKGQKGPVTFFKNGKNETQFGVIKEPQTTQAIIKPDKGYNTIVVPWKYVKPLINAQFGVNEINPHGRYAQEAGAGQFDPRTFGVTEGAKSYSTQIKWICPNCKKPTPIDIEIESPSDYIACTDCMNCNKEIHDPKLDQQVYKTVIDHFAGKADYQNDTLK